MDERAGTVSKYTDEEYLLKEISRLKTETEEIWRILKERENRLNELERSNNTCMLKISDTLAKLSEQLEDTEAAILEVLSESRENISEDVAKPLRVQYEKLSQELQEKLDAVKLEVISNSGKQEEMRTTIEEFGEVLSEKAEKRSIAALHQRLSTMFSLGIVNLVGTMMTLALLCYLIISLAR